MTSDELYAQAHEVVEDQIMTTARYHFIAVTIIELLSHCPEDPEANRATCDMLTRELLRRLGYANWNAAVKLVKKY